MCMTIQTPACSCATGSETRSPLSAPRLVASPTCPDSSSRTTSTISAATPPGSATCSRPATRPRRSRPARTGRPPTCCGTSPTVQHWWCAMMSNRPQSADEMGYVEPDRPEGYDALLAAYDDAHAAFVAALEAADPAEPAYSWSGDPATTRSAFTYRRQAHEALIHRLDAELTAGAVTPLDPALAADGVDEALDRMYGDLPAVGQVRPAPPVRRVPDRPTRARRSGPSSASSPARAPDGEVYRGREGHARRTRPRRAGRRRRRRRRCRLSTPGCGTGATMPGSP